MKKFIDIPKGFFKPLRAKLKFKPFFDVFKYERERELNRLWKMIEEDRKNGNGPRIINRD